MPLDGSREATSLADAGHVHLFLAFKDVHVKPLAQLQFGVLFGLFTLETVTYDTDLEWIGALSPTRYYDPAAIIVDGEYDVAGALVLLATALTLLIASAEWFRRRDV